MFPVSSFSICATITELDSLKLIPPVSCSAYENSRNEKAYTIKQQTKIDITAFLSTIHPPRFLPCLEFHPLYWYENIYFLDKSYNMNYIG